MAMGRPSKYDPRFCDEVEDLMRQGFSKTAAAGAIGVDRDTFLNWAREHPDFFGAVKRGEATRETENLVAKALRQLRGQGLVRSVRRGHTAVWVIIEGRQG